MYKVNLTNCYNEKEVKGNSKVGGIIGYSSQVNIRNCYNTKDITGVEQIGGIAGELQAFDQNSYENNYLYYCYNIGNITGTTSVGSISGNFEYYDTDYVYYLKGTASEYSGRTTEYKAGENIAMLEKIELIITIKSKFNENFKEDYIGENSVNEGYPILNWQ